MGAGSSTSAHGLKGEKWTSMLYFYAGDGEWKTLRSNQVIDYFRDDLQAEKEIITHSEIRKFNLIKHDIMGWLPGLVGFWHEYTLVETTIGSSKRYWSFEKNMKGIAVQRSENRDEVRCRYGDEERNEDRTEGRRSKVKNKENVLDIAHWIINRNALGHVYDVKEANCHFFASELYEAITRTSQGRRLDNTK